LISSSRFLSPGKKQWREVKRGSGAGMRNERTSKRVGKSRAFVVWWAKTEGWQVDGCRFEACLAQCQETGTGGMSREGGAGRRREITSERVGGARRDFEESAE
jgi:hypothetical protein